MSILIENINKTFANQVVLDDVSLEIEDGELFVLLGASGSGKSTLLRMIAGLLPVEEGRIYMHGKDVTYLPPQARNTGFVFQNYSLFRHMSVAENIEFGLEVRGVPKAKRAAKRDELLELIGLSGYGKRLPRQLSGGQQQRVAVARALAFEPSVLLLDEPFGALDVKIRAQLRQTLYQIQRHLNVTTILVTHDQEEAFELADRIGVIDHGKLLEVGAPLELYRRPRNKFVAQFVGTATLLVGRWQEGQLTLGNSTIPAPHSPDKIPPSGRVAVLLRPEDVTLAHKGQTVRGYPLGTATVEQVYFLGTLQRVMVQLQPLPGIRSLNPEYGVSDIPMQVALLSDETIPYEVGQTLQVGFHAFHLLSHSAPHPLVAIDAMADAPFLQRAGEWLQQFNDGPVSVVAVDDLESGAAGVIAHAESEITPYVPRALFMSRVGDFEEEVAEEAYGGDYDMVVVKSETGTLAERLTAKLGIPVLAWKGNRTTLKKMLLCTAGGEPGKADIRFGGRLARLTGASATLLHIAADSSAANAITRHLEQGIRTLQAQGVRADLKIREGKVLDELLAESQAGNYDLIVVGGHIPTYGTLRDFNLANEILHHADRSVLVVPEPRTEKILG
jgi:ABC-type Fe3+/spermidine/putrescine transport system ATPase subunit/nucleotide-binding universal stress UspA family protein